MKAKLTVRSVEAVLPAATDIIIWDTELAGFGCKITPKGKRSYFLYYRTADGQQRRPAIGAHGAVKPEAARDIARTWLSDVARGNDPSLSRTQQRTAPTVGDLCERYIEEYAQPRKKASSIKNDKRQIAVHLIPAFGGRKVASIARADIAALHHRLRATPYEANRLLALSSKMFGLAERWGMRPDGSNPAKNIDRFREKKRERYLAAAEVGRLWSVLTSTEVVARVSPAALAAVKLLILTGRRLNEVLKLEWRHVDLETKVLRLPDTKTGSLLVSLGEPAVQLLIDLRRAAPAADFVIQGREGRPLVNLQKPWHLIRGLAGLDDVRLHDLRHTFASIGAGLGMSLPLLGRLLGHKEASTTARYAHLAQDPVRMAADAIGAEIGRMATGQAANDKDLMGATA